MANVEIKNPDLLEKLNEQTDNTEVPYPTIEAKQIIEKLHKGKSTAQIDKILRAIAREKEQNQKQLIVKGDLIDATEHSLFAMGFRVKHGYEQKPKYAQNANTETFDINKPVNTITWE